MARQTGLLCLQAEEARPPAMAQRQISHLRGDRASCYLRCRADRMVTLVPRSPSLATSGQAEPPVECLSAAVDRQHAGNQVLTCALCFLQERPDDPAADAEALMAGVDLDARQVDLAR